MRKSITSIGKKTLKARPELAAFIAEVQAKDAALEQLKAQKSDAKKALKSAEKALKKQLKDKPSKKEAPKNAEKPAAAPKAKAATAKATSKLPVKKAGIPSKRNGNRLVSHCD